MTNTASSNNYQTPGRVYDLEPNPQLVTRQQLRDPAFYAKVRDRVFKGSVVVADGQTSSLRLGDQVYPLSDPATMAALETSQAGWVDAPAPVINSLNTSGVQPTYEAAGSNSWAQLLQTEG